MLANRLPCTGVRQQQPQVDAKEKMLRAESRLLSKDERHPSSVPLRVHNAQQPGDTGRTLSPCLTNLHIHAEVTPASWFFKVFTESLKF